MNLSDHYEEFRDALVSAFFNEELLKELVQYEFNQKLDNIVAQGPLNRRAFELIQWMESEGKTDELFAAALRRKPGNPALRKLAEEFKREIESAQSSILQNVLPLLSSKKIDDERAEAARREFARYESAGGMWEAMIYRVAGPSGQDAEEWSQELLSTTPKRICVIEENEKPQGTGFLVAPDLIMTNDHVIPAGAALTNYQVRFDFRGKAKRTSLATLKIVQELMRSPKLERDYLILKLEAVPAEERGYFTLEPHSFEKQEPVFILGHPAGQAQRLSFGIVVDSYAPHGAIAYTANTLPGSSGSPVFTEDWKLAAIHHHGQKNMNNHGITAEAILNHLRESGRIALLPK